jgi:acyl dehydratase
MNTPLYFEDVSIGQEIPHSIKETLTTRSVVKWAAAVKDFYEIHYDKDFARLMGMPDIIAHGPNKCALLSRLLLEWIGEQGRLHKLTCTHKASNFPGETLLCKGKVKNKYSQDGKNYVECELWVENQTGKIAAPGLATVSLPAKGDS